MLTKHAGIVLHSPGHVSVCLNMFQETQNATEDIPNVDYHLYGS
jgi:hypothetical protein